MSVGWFCTQHSIPISYGIQMNLLAQIMKIERYANVCASAIATLLSHALMMMIVCWMNDGLTGLLTAPLLGTPTIYNDKQRTTTRFSFRPYSFSIYVYCASVSELTRLFTLNTYFRFHWNARKKKRSFLTKRAIYDNDMCEIFGFICASMLFRCGRNTPKMA